MLSWVFFAQPVGQLLANVLSLAAVEAYRPWITEKVHYCEPQDDECFRAIDRLWRLVVGIGIIPAVIALAFRFTIPESPRYTLDILQHPQKTLQDTVDFYPVAEGHPEQGTELLPITPEIHVPRRISISSEIGADEIVDSDSESYGRPSDAHLHRPATIPQLPPGDPNFVPPLASWTDANQFFITEGNWQYLLGTSLSWLFLDFACTCSLLSKTVMRILTIDVVYGLGLSSPQIVSHIWEEPQLDDKKQPIFPSVYATLRDNSLHTLVMVSIGTITGGLLMIKIVKYVSPKVIQFWGFLVLFVLFIVTGSAWGKLLESSRSGLIVLYVLSHIAFNLGPNVTTFIVSTLTLLSFTGLTQSRSLPKFSPRATAALATASPRPPGNSAPGSCKSSSRTLSRPAQSKNSTTGRRRTSAKSCRS
jgi:PHS family inorganic phosphate transporter-like MFS transporter